MRRGNFLRFLMAKNCGLMIFIYLWSAYRGSKDPNINTEGWKKWHLHNMSPIGGATEAHCVNHYPKVETEISELYVLRNIFQIFHSWCVLLFIPAPFRHTWLSNVLFSHKIKKYTFFFFLNKNKPIVHCLVTWCLSLTACSTTARAGNQEEL